MNKVKEFIKNDYWYANNRKILPVFFATLFAFFAMVSCDKEHNSITLNETSLFLESRDTLMLIATVHSNHETNKVIWKSSNSDIATVTSDGLVTAISKGKATITATVQNRKQKATCSVTVTDYREKWVGDWDFVQMNFDFDFGSASWDTTYYSGKISLVDDNPSMLKINNGTVTVSPDGVFLYGVRGHGRFEGSNKIHMHSEGGAMNGSTKWTKDINGTKRNN